MQLSESAKRSYGSTKIHLNKMAKKAKTMDEILNETRAKRDKALKSGTQEEIKVAEANYQRSIQSSQDESITYQSALRAAEAKSTGKSTYSEISKNFGIDAKKFEDNLYLGGDKKKLIADNEDGFISSQRDAKEYSELKKKKLQEHGTLWLKGQIDGNGDFINPEAEQFVRDNGTLSGLLPGVIASVTGEKDTSGDSSSDGTEKKLSKKEKFNAIVTKNKEVTIDTVRSIKELYPNMPDTELFKTIEISYPKKETESDKEYIQRIGTLVKQLGKESISSNKEKQNREQLIKESSTYNPNAKQVVGTYLGKTVESENGKFYLLNDSGRRIKNLAPAEVERIQKVNNDKA
jgi:hypothetical protein